MDAVCHGLGFVFVYIDDIGVASKMRRAQGLLVSYSTFNVFMIMAYSLMIPSVSLVAQSSTSLGTVSLGVASPLYQTR